jgi:hypothetical protein
MQPEAGEADIHGQGPLELGAAVIEELRLVGDGSGHPVADDVHGHGPLVEEAEMEQVHPEGAAGGTEQRSIGAEADVSVGVEIEPGE